MGVGMVGTVVMARVVVRVRDVRVMDMCMAVVMQMLGLGTGPFLAGLLTNGSSYTLVELACIFFFLASFALLLLPMQAHRRLLAPQG